MEDGLTLSPYIGVDGREKIKVLLAPNLRRVMIDKVQVQQVLLNLVRNALEAIKAVSGGKIIIETAMGTPDFVTVSVTDNGPGLPPEVTSKLFQPFVTTKKRGMGIGLSICQTIVESHGGRIWAEPNPPHGVGFYFRLPVIPVEDV